MRIRFIPFLAVAAALLTGCHKEQARPAAAGEAPPVRAALLRVAPQPLAASVAVTGTLVSSARVDVKAQTTGRVLRFDKEEGDAVAAGEAVIWVDDENCKLAVQQAASAIKVAQAGLARTQVMEAHQRSELERARNLVRSGGITDRDLKAAEVAEQDARAQVALAAAQLEQARAALAVAQKQLRDAVIYSPVAGQIQNKFANPGAYVEPPTAVFTVVDNRRMELESPVAASELAPVRAGQRVTFRVRTYLGAVFEGRVIEISPEADAATRSVKVRIRVDNSAGRLRAGMFAEGEILTGVTAQAIVVPAASVYRDDRSAKTAFVFVAENHRAARRQVRIGRELEGQLEILEGLKPGDLLLAERGIEIAEGVRLEPQPAAANSAKEGQ
ncbi:MAG: efflux RND transporter periplasmic adaptor subunit [Acidobacteria bacterium]|nr:efflux RND transporter periplasmic adaptor subunit [Acidobacteriota bacterium]